MTLFNFILIEIPNVMFFVMLLQSQVQPCYLEKHNYCSNKRYMLREHMTSLYQDSNQEFKPNKFKKYWIFSVMLMYFPQEKNCCPIISTKAKDAMNLVMSCGQVINCS